MLEQLQTNDYLIIKKLSATSNPVAPTPAKEGFIPGADNGPVSLPVEYEIEGFLRAPMKVGEPLLVNRIKRNGVVIPGMFSTSPIVKINGHTVETANSIYQIGKINE